MASFKHNIPLILPPEIPNPNTNISLLSLCNYLQEAKQVHALLVKSAQISDPFAAGRLAEFYAVSDHGSLDLAQLLVNSSPEPNTFAWNALIRGHLKNRDPYMAIKVYEQMIQNSVQSDQFTFTLVLKGCANLRDLGIARQLFSQIVKQGLALNGFLINKLIHVFAISGSIVYARRVFDKSPDRDVVTWNSMLEGYAEIGDSESVHKVFDEMPVRDVVSWNTLISYQVDSGEFALAVDLFRRMDKDGARMNSITFISVLTAAAHLGALGLGQWAHSCIVRSKIDLDENLASALINMYAKCGFIEGAIDAFFSTKKKNIDVFNALLTGLAVNGHSLNAFEYFSKMEASNVKPNAITFLAILNACSHGGLVEEGLRVFDEMKARHGVIPDVVHYGCIVDLLSRAGLFSEVEEIMNRMPIEPDVVMWKAVLSASRVHRSLILVKKAERCLFKLAEDDPAVCVLLANAYAAGGELTQSYELRKRMRRGKMVKQPGCSAVEVNGVVHEFFAGDSSHFRKDEIYGMLREMLWRLKGLGYEPDEEEVLLGIGEGDVKRESLAYHSEKLAVAYGLIGTAKGTTIRVVKNLRMCGDCHAAFKLLSVIYERKIIVRDSNRFHHFSEGSCSCKEYW